MHRWFCGIRLPSKAQLLSSDKVWWFKLTLSPDKTVGHYAAQRLTAVIKGRANIEKQFDTRSTSTVEKSTSPTSRSRKKETNGKYIQQLVNEEEQPHLW